MTVKGALNGVNFSISRTKTSTKGSLLFLYDDGDLTTQSVKETQDLINEKLGISPQVLARTMFHGQHALNELLESTDTKLKDELSLVVPLSVWQGAVTHTRKQAREAIKSASEFEGMLTIRSEDLFKLEERLEAAEAELESKKAAFETMKGQVHEEIESILTNIGRTHDIKGIAVFEEELHRAGLALEKIELERQSALASRDQDLALQEKEVEFLNSELARFDAELRSAEQELSDQSLNYALANERVVNLQEMWRIDLSSGMPESFALPDNCPTCHQSISSHQDDHLQNLEVTIERDIEGTLARLSAARSIVDETRKAKLLAFLSRLAAEESLSASEKCLVDKRNYWKNLLDEIEKRQGDARAFQQSAATTFASTAKQIEGESRIQSLQARLDAEKGSLELFSNAVDAVRNELIGCKQRVTQIKAEKAEKTSMAKILEDLSDAFGQRGIQTFVMQNAVSSLESFAQAYLDQLSEGAQRLQLTLDSGDRILRRAFVRGADGIYKERALASLSGGQWRRCSLALNLGFSDLVASRANFRPSVCVMDEPLTHLDHSGRADVGRVLRGILRRTSECESDRSVGFHVSTILVILQDLAAEELEESFDCIDEIVKENGVSSLRLEEVGLVV